MEYVGTLTSVCFHFSFSASSSSLHRHLLSLTLIHSITHSVTSSLPHRVT